MAIEGLDTAGHREAAARSSSRKLASHRVNASNFETLLALAKR